MPRKKTVNLIAYRAPLESSHVPRLPICCDAGESNAASAQQVASLSSRKWIRLGLGRFSEVPLDEHNAADSWGQ